MQTWINNHIDKSQWPTGEWQNEPDKAQWIHANLDCLIVRNSGGALCGYVGVPESHPFFELDYGNEKVRVDVHGGLTFADRCRPGKDDSHGICHVEEGAANKVVWWLGFDCAHWGDISPAYDSACFHDESYKNFVYVKDQVEYLAEQLSGVS